MTITGPDLSSFEHGVNVPALPSPFVMAKCTEGTYYADADYEGWCQQAVASGKIFAAYHFISGQDPGAQAAWLAAHIGDKSLPVMLDWEPEGSYKPTLAQLYAVADAMTAAGLRVRLAYGPRWHWANIGSPPLSGLTSRGIGLVSSSYPGGSGYPGDNGAGWQPYGGITPLIWQYTDAAVEGGQRVGDMNAYRGTRDQLAAFLGTATSAHPTSTGGPDMPLSQQDISAVASATATALLNLQVPRAGTMGGTTSLGAVLSWSDQHIIDITAAAEKAPAVDIPALVAALAPLITAGATADQLAAAVVAHLASTLAKG
jgi:hypothetical protein